MTGPEDNPKKDEMIDTIELDVTDDWSLAFIEHDRCEKQHRGWLLVNSKGEPHVYVNDQQADTLVRIAINDRRLEQMRALSAAADFDDDDDEDHDFDANGICRMCGASAGKTDDPSGCN